MMKIPCETCVDEDHCTYNGSCYKQRVILREKAEAMRERMKEKAIEPLPQHIQDQTMRDLQR